MKKVLIAIVLCSFVSFAGTSFRFNAISKFTFAVNVFTDFLKMPVELRPSLRDSLLLLKADLENDFAQEIVLAHNKTNARQIIDLSAMIVALDIMADFVIEPTSERAAAIIVLLRKIDEKI